MSPRKPKRIAPALAVALSRLIAHHRALWETTDSPALARVAAEVGASAFSVRLWRNGRAPIAVFAAKISALADQLPAEEG